jgi:hypothetical protein
MAYTLTFPDLTGVTAIVEALADRPYRQVAGSIADIQAQIQAQARAEHDAAQAKADVVASEAAELAALRAAQAEKRDPEVLPPGVGE